MGPPPAPSSRAAWARGGSAQTCWGRAGEPTAPRQRACTGSAAGGTALSWRESGHSAAARCPAQPSGKSAVATKSSGGFPMTLPIRRFYNRSASKTV
eukprot:scaffold205220_cov32-Prasinocladus_malaysianus.AAC.1